MFSVRRRFVFSLIAMTGVASAWASDWPQWQGPDRTGLSKETGLLKKWPESGPPIVWKAKNLGSSFGGPAIAASRIFGMGNRQEDEIVWALDEKTGKEIWHSRIAKSNTSIGRQNDGPACTPTVDGDKLYVLGISGDLVCLETDTGKEIWHRNFVKDFGSSIPTWGYCESPLVESAMLIATPGGKGATIAAFDKLSGKTIWTGFEPAKEKSAESKAEVAKKEEPKAAPKQGPGGRMRRTIPEGVEPAGYASPIAFTVGGLRQVAVFTAKGGAGFRMSDGQLLWRNNKAANGTANITSPIFHDNRVFFTSDYGTGCVEVELSPDGKAKEVFFNKEMKNHHGGVVLLGDYLYGFNSAILTCMKFSDGKVAWKDRSVGKGSVGYADGLLYLLSERGDLAIAEANSNEYKEISRIKIPDRTNKNAWTHPVIANGKLYIRDQETLICYDVKQH